MGTETVDKAENARPKSIWKKWLIIAIVAVVVIIIAIPTGLVISMNNSPYDCSFTYAKVDNPLIEIARKHTYYNAADKILEVELNQDLLNSLIKDNLAALKLDLPDKVTITEILFNTRDQRLYINAKYGNINVPLSAKLTVKTSDSGLLITGGDLKIVNSDAPGFVKKQIPQDSLAFSIKYADFGIPPVFSIKEIKYGTGSIKVSIQLIPDKITQLAMDYRNNLVAEIDKFKSGQSEIVGTFLTKLLGTDILSDAKVKDYVDQALGNEELVNSAIYFATAPDLKKYTDTLETAQKKVEEWAAPLQTVKYYGSIDETVSKVLYDQKLRDLLSWFLPAKTMDEYTATAENYYGMYKDYYSMYLNVLDSIDNAVAGINTRQITDYTGQLLDLTAQAEDARKEARDGLSQLDDKAVNDLVGMFEKNKNAAKGYVADIIDIRNSTNEFLSYSYNKEVKEFNSLVQNRSKFIVDVIKQLKRQEYESALTRLANDGVIDSKTSKFVDKYSKEIDVDSLSAYIEKYY